MTVTVTFRLFSVVTDITPFGSVEVHPASSVAVSIALSIVLGMEDNVYVF
jgi:hypothetical protein